MCATRKCIVIIAFYFSVLLDKFPDIHPAPQAKHGMTTHDIMDLVKKNYSSSNNIQAHRRDIGNRERLNEYISQRT